MSLRALICCCILSTSLLALVRSRLRCQQMRMVGGLMHPFPTERDLILILWSYRRKTTCVERTSLLSVAFFTSCAPSTAPSVLANPGTWRGRGAVKSRGSPTTYFCSLVSCGRYLDRGC